MPGETEDVNEQQDEVVNEVQAPRRFGALLTMLGLAVSGAGIDFLLSGGGFSFIVTGAGILAAGVLCFIGSRHALPVYGVAWASTFLGSFMDSGTIEVARVALPSLIGLYMFASVKARLR